MSFLPVGEEPDDHSSNRCSLYRRGRRVSWPMPCPSYLWQGAWQPQFYSLFSVQEGEWADICSVLPTCWRGAWPPQFYSLFSVQEGKESELTYAVSFLPVARSLTTTVLLTVLCTGGEEEWADLCRVLPTCWRGAWPPQFYSLFSVQRGRRVSLPMPCPSYLLARGLTTTVLLTVLCTGGEGEWADLCRVLPTCWRGAWPPQFYSLFSVQEGKESELTYICSVLPTCWRGAWPPQFYSLFSVQEGKGEWADLCSVFPTCGEEPGHHSSTYRSLYRRGRRVSWPMQCPSYLWRGAWPPQLNLPISVQEGKERELTYAVSFLPVARSLTTTVLLTVLCTGGEGE
jgi:hypothetical protein